MKWEDEVEEILRRNFGNKPSPKKQERCNIVASLDPIDTDDPCRFDKGHDGPHSWEPPE